MRELHSGPRIDPDVSSPRRSDSPRGALAARASRVQDRQVVRIKKPTVVVIASHIGSTDHYRRGERSIRLDQVSVSHPQLASSELFSSVWDLAGRIPMQDREYDSYPRDEEKEQQTPRCPQLPPLGSRCRQ